MNERVYWNNLDHWSVSQLYLLVKDQLGSLNQRIDAVSKLEVLTNQNFKSTVDFFEKMEKHIALERYTGEDLLSARKLKGYSQQTVGWKLDVSKQFVSEMERDSKPLTTKALRFIEDCGIQRPSEPILVDKTALKTKEL